MSWGGLRECSVCSIHKVLDRFPLVWLFETAEADLIFCGLSDVDDPHFFSLIEGEGTQGEVQRGDTGTFSGGAEF